MEHTAVQNNALLHELLLDERLPLPKTWSGLKILAFTGSD
jgi:hypothetical protein